MYRHVPPSLLPLMVVCYWEQVLLGCSTKEEGSLSQKRREVNASQENDSKAPYHLILKTEHSNSQFHQENCWGKSRQWTNCQNHFLFWNVQAWKLKQICDKENSKILSASVVWITPWFWHLHTPRINQQVRAKLFCFDRFSHDKIVFMPLHSSVFKVQKDPFHNPFIFSRNYVHLFSWNYND